MTAIAEPHAIRAAATVNKVLFIPSFLYMVILI